MKEAAIRFFSANMAVVEFAYGLMFFAMGLAIALQSRRESELRIARHLPLLGTFGILQALAAWGQVFIPIQQAYTPPPIIIVLQALHAILTALAFTFLMAFGTELLAEKSHARWAWLRHLPYLLTAIWGSSFLLYPVVMLPARYETWLAASDTWARYMLGFPGGILVSVALSRQTEELRRESMQHLVRPLEWAIFSFAAYAVVAGLIVPPAGFFPSTAINSGTFLRWTGLPVELLRALTGLGMAAFMIRVMEMFDIEAARRTEALNRMRTVLQERDRIARELHDGVIQSLYALGLGIENLGYVMTDEPRLARRRLQEVMDGINQVIHDIRTYIMDLRLPGQTDLSLGRKVEAIAGEASRVYHVPIEMDLRDLEGLTVDPDTSSELSLIVKEAVSNAVRHGQPRRVRVGAHVTEDGLVVYVQDDGKGFDVGTLRGSSGFGLGNMRKRAALLGGELDVDSRPGEGTTVMARVPLKAGAEHRRAMMPAAPASAGEGLRRSSA